MYPIDFAMEATVGALQAGGEIATTAVEQLSVWVNERYAIDWTADTITELNGEEVFDKLVETSTAWHGKKLDDWVAGA